MDNPIHFAIWTVLEQRAAEVSTPWIVLRHRTKSRSNLQPKKIPFASEAGAPVRRLKVSILSVCCKILVENFVGFHMFQYSCAINFLIQKSIFIIFHASWNVETVAFLSV